MYKLSVEYFNGEIDEIYSNDKNTIERIGNELFNEDAFLWLSYNNGPSVEFCERFHFGW